MKSFQSDWNHGPGKVASLSETEPVTAIFARAIALCLCVFWLIVLAGLVGCSSETAEERRLKDELAAANAKITELQQQLQEKERYLKLVLENPDKGAYDALPRVDPDSGRSNYTWEEMENRYVAFLETFPSSPLVFEVRQLKAHVDELIRARAEKDEWRAAFDKIPVGNLQDINAFPEKHVGTVFRVKGTIALLGGLGSGGHIISLNADGVDVVVAVDESLYRWLSASRTSLERIPGEFSIKIARDPKTGSVKYFLEKVLRGR